MPSRDANDDLMVDGTVCDDQNHRSMLVMPHVSSWTYRPRHRWFLLHCPPPQHHRQDKVVISKRNGPAAGANGGTLLPPPTYLRDLM